MFPTWKTSNDDRKRTCVLFYYPIGVGWHSSRLPNIPPRLAPRCAINTTTNKGSGFDRTSICASGRLYGWCSHRNCSEPTARSRFRGGNLQFSVCVRPCVICYHNTHVKQRCRRLTWQYQLVWKSWTRWLYLSCRTFDLLYQPTPNTTNPGQRQLRGISGWLCAKHTFWTHHTDSRRILIWLFDSHTTSTNSRSSSLLSQTIEMDFEHSIAS